MTNNRIKLDSPEAFAAAMDRHAKFVANALEMESEIVKEGFTSINKKLEAMTEAIKQLESQQKELNQQLQSTPERISLPSDSSIQES